MFNALDVMENRQFLEELKFGVGDGHLHYYFYNWRCPEIAPEKVSFTGNVPVVVHSTFTVMPVGCQ